MNGASGVCVSTTVISCGRPLAGPFETQPAPARIARHHVQPRQPLVELRRRRHLADDEAELVRQPRGQRLGAEPEGDAVRRLRKDDGRKREEQLTVVRRGLPGQDLAHFRELGGAGMRGRR